MNNESCRTPEDISFTYEIPKSAGLLQRIKERAQDRLAAVRETVAGLEHEIDYQQRQQDHTKDNRSI